LPILRRHSTGGVEKPAIVTRPPLCYKGVILDSAYRFDLLVEDQVVVEVKAIEVVLPDFAPLRFTRKSQKLIYGARKLKIR
jgi:hypothetical protein